MNGIRCLSDSGCVGLIGRNKTSKQIRSVCIGKCGTNQNIVGCSRNSIRSVLIKLYRDPCQTYFTRILNSIVCIRRIASTVIQPYPIPQFSSGTESEIKGMIILPISPCCNIYFGYRPCNDGIVVT